jgi:hypothetical protein
MVQNRFFILIVMVILLPACKIDRKARVDRDKFTFKVSDDALLFFRNVRQVYYDFQDLPQAHWYAFRHSDRPVDPQSPLITPVIVVDWMKNESYILVEPNERMAGEAEIVVRERNKKGITFEYSLSQRGRENMLEFTTKIYEGIMEENDLFIVSGGREYPLFQSDEQRDIFRVVMADYYRLTRVF